MHSVPGNPKRDETLALRREGYRFFINRFERYSSNLFTSRLMLKPALCARGPEAVALFYRSDKLTRVGAMPPTALRLLQDKRSVQQLDDEAHGERKAMFMGMMNESSIDRLCALFAGCWQTQVRQWRHCSDVNLMQEVPPILTRAVCRWAGVPLPNNELDRRTRELTAMVEQAATVGPAQWRAQYLRHRAERWARGVVRGARHRSAGMDEPLMLIAHHREGRRVLPVKTAAVELLNILRPVVAVTRYIAFIAHALLHNPLWARRLRVGDEADLDSFVQEVRRFYPFFPAVGGRARQAFQWRGLAVPQGQWLLLDLYGTNHDPAHWNEPWRFQPERFLDAEIANQLVPQGGGGVDHSHRCAGEAVTVALMKEAVRRFTQGMHYRVRQQNLAVPLDRLPTAPASGMILSDVAPATGM